MYTQCPECNAIFALTQEQLAACGGLVRCGQCAAVFRADERLFDALPETVTPLPGVPSAPPLYGPRRDDDPAIPTITQRPPGRASRVAWSLGTLLLSLFLIGQGAYFYRNELARSVPLARPWLEHACAYAGCSLQPAQDVNQIELLDAQVAPSAEYEDVLSIRASLVNHARYAQPYPLMEVSLLDSNGVTLSRRSFKPEQYLEGAQRARTGMVPERAVAAALQITSLDKRAVGYEIRLVAP